MKLILEISDLINSDAPLKARIEKSLEAICLHYAMERGFVYQPSQGLTFELRESFGSTSNDLRTEFVLSAAPAEVQTFFEEHSFLRVYDKEKASKTEKAVTDFFNMESIILLSFTDTQHKIIGFIGLGGKVLREEKLNSDELDALKACLTIISQQAALREYQKREKQAAQTMENIMNNMGVDIYVNDFDTHEMLYANESMAAPYGGYENFKGKRCWEALYTDKIGECSFCPKPKLIDENGNPTNVYSWDYQRPFDKSWFRVFSRAFRWIDGRMAHVITSVDTTENKRYEAIIKHMSEHDDLTDLPNRRKLLRDIQEFIEKDKDGLQEGYILFMDLNKFKAVNDTYGHAGGDELLIKIAEYLKSITAVEDRAYEIYRQSGDEFIAFLPNISKEVALKVATQIVERSHQPWVLKKGDAHCEISIGVAHYPTGGHTAEDLIRVADAAMYEVKKLGSGGIQLAGV